MSQPFFPVAQIMNQNKIGIGPMVEDEAERIGRGGEICLANFARPFPAPSPSQSRYP